MRPSSKVQAGAASGAFTVVLVYLAGQFGVDMPAEVASAITVLVGTIVAYWKKEVIL